MSVRDLCRGWFERLSAESAAPERTAAAFALGVFLSFSPFLGLQIVLGFGAAFVLKLSRAAVFVGLCTNLPAFMVPWYLLTTAAGAALLNVSVTPELGVELQKMFELPAYRMEFWQGLGEVAGPLLSAFVLGTTAGALVAGTIAYFTAVRVLIRLRASPPDPVETANL